MTVFNIAFRNIFKKSLSDYAIYFFTLCIGVVIFYLFNAVPEQAAMLGIYEYEGLVIKVLQSLMKVLTCFVVTVFAIVMIHANKFLMKKRSGEFAMYMMLGMGKGNIAVLLLVETILIGFVSLVVGLLAGIGLSQVMSILVANLFDADMSNYAFTVSGEAIKLTVAFFALMFLLVIIFDNLVLGNMKLRTLLQHHKTSERVILRNPILCVLVFLLGTGMLVFAYYRVAFDSPFRLLASGWFTGSIILGIISTYLIFWSVSGMLLRVFSSFKKTYYSGLNAFTFRQISSKVNTNITSLGSVCLLLFFSICALLASFAMREQIQASQKNNLLADAQIIYKPKDKISSPHGKKLSDFFAMCGIDLTESFGEYIETKLFTDENFRVGTFLDGQSGVVLPTEGKTIIRDETRGFNLNEIEKFMSLSDYNVLMKLYGKEELSLAENEFVIVCNYDVIKESRDEVLNSSKTISIFGKELRSKYNECIDGFIDLSLTYDNRGVFVVHDIVLANELPSYYYLTGKYFSTTKSNQGKQEKTLRTRFEEFVQGAKGSDIISGNITLQTKYDLLKSNLSVTAIIVFVGLYIGSVFLIVAGVLLALKELSTSVESVQRYSILRKIGTDEATITRSLTFQMLVLFALPLLLAIVHSFFGMKFGVAVLSFGGFRISSFLKSSIFMPAIILGIYGGYFFLTLFLCKKVIKESNFRYE